MKVIDDPETLRKLAIARLWASRKWPYLTSIFHGFIPVVVELGSLPGGADGTMACDEEMRLYIEPPALARWTAAQAGSVLVHEAMHVLRRHGSRRGIRDPRAWNLAADAEINDDLTDPAYELPDGGGVQPSMFGQPVGKTAEEYYASFPSSKSKKGAGSGAGDGQSGRIGHGACGRCATNPKGKPGDGTSPGDGQGGDSSGSGGAPPGAPSGRSAAEIEGAIRTAQGAMAAAMGRGTLPAGLARHLEDPNLEPVVPWEQRLLMRVRGGAAVRAGAVEHRYHKPSRRQAGIGYGAGVPIMPHPVAPTPKVIVALDTSGSMRNEDLARGIIETVSIMRSLGIEVTFMTNDAEVHESRQVRSMADLIPLLKGGGGTDFRPVFTHVEKKRLRPDVLVFVTDGDGTAPTTPPPYRTIWLIVSQYEGRVVPPPARWGEVIRC